MPFPQRQARLFLPRRKAISALEEESQSKSRRNVLNDHHQPNRINANKKHQDNIESQRRTAQANLWRDLPERFHRTMSKSFQLKEWQTIMQRFRHSEEKTKTKKRFPSAHSIYLQLFGHVPIQSPSMNSQSHRVERRSGEKTSPSERKSSTYPCSRRRPDSLEFPFASVFPPRLRILYPNCRTEHLVGRA